MSENVGFLPFHAINEFMRDEFKLSIIKETLNNLPNITVSHQKKIDRLIKKYVKIPGFRNSDKAPVMVKILPVSKAFSTSPELVAAILDAWSDLNSELRHQVVLLLKKLDWKFYDENIPIADIVSTITKNWYILPEEVDRTKMPGFYPYWPKDNDFETLYTAFIDCNPEIKVSIDRVSLMVVWISLRLPYHIIEDNEHGDPTG